MPDGGEVIISLYRLAESIVVEVKDTGVGIAGESQKNIFGGFFHCLETDLYSTRKPFDFGVGGEGLDLLRIKVCSNPKSVEKVADTLNGEPRRPVSTKPLDVHRVREGG